MELGLPLFLVLCILLFAASLEYSKFNCITPWPSFLLSTCFSSLLGYYFIPAASLELSSITGTDVASMADTALTINLTGIAVTFLSFYFVSYTLKRRRKSNDFLVETETRDFFGFANISDQRCAIAFGTIAVCSGVIIFCIMAYAGTFPLLTEDVTSNRGFINSYPELRPIINFATSTIAAITSFVTLTVVLKTKELPKFTLIATVFLIGCGLLTGTRSYLSGLLPGLLTGFSLLWLLRKSNFKISFSLYLAYQIVFIVLGGISGLLRDLTPSRFFELLAQEPLGFGLYSLSYSYTGNNFSDLRDFSWILSKFNGEFYFGKTLLADILGFVPSTVLPFRDEFTIGRVTNVIVGLPTETHFGIRSSDFGVWYLNFGWVGVAIEGCILGVGYAIIQDLFSSYFQRLVQGQEKVKIFSLCLLYFLPSIPQTLAQLSPYFILYSQALIIFLVYLYGRTLTASPIKLLEIQGTEN
jgi:hypothetical protein